MRARPAGARRPRRSGPRPDRRPSDRGAYGGRAARGRRAAAAGARRRRRRDDVAAARGVAAPAARRGPPRHRRRGLRRRASAARGGLDRLGQERAGQAGRLALAGRAPQVRERQDARRGPAGPARSAVRDAGRRRRRAARPRTPRRPRSPPTTPGPSAARAGSCSQWPPEYGRRSPSAVRSMAASRRRSSLGRADVEDGLRRAARTRRAGRPARATSVGRRRGAASGTRSSHFPTRVSSIGAVGSGAGQLDDEDTRASGPGPGAPTAAGRRRGGRPRAAGRGGQGRGEVGHPGDGTRDGRRGIVRSAWPPSRPRRSRVRRGLLILAAVAATHRLASRSRWGPVLTRSPIADPIAAAPPSASPTAVAAPDPAQPRRRVPRSARRPRRRHSRRSRRSPSASPRADAASAPPPAIRRRAAGSPRPHPRERYGVPGVSVTDPLPGRQRSWLGVSGLADVAPRRRSRRRHVVRHRQRQQDVHGGARPALVEDGDGRPRRAGPDVPARCCEVDPKITVRQLLDHTSGLRDYFFHPAIDTRSCRDPSRRWDAADVDEVRRQAVFQARARAGTTRTPTTSSSGMLAERVGGAPLGHQIRDALPRAARPAPHLLPADRDRRADRSPTATASDRRRQGAGPSTCPTAPSRARSPRS